MLGNKSKDLIGLYKNTVKLIGKDKDLLYPILHMAIYRSISVCLTASCVYFFFVAKNPGSGFLSVLAALSFVPISAYLQVRHKAALSWMSFEVLQGKDTDLNAGLGRLTGIKGKLFLIAMMDMLTSRSSASSTKEGGIKELLVSLALSVFKSVWDLVGNFMLPTIAIEKCGFEEAVTKLKSMKQNLPSAIAGVLGLNVAGGVATALLGPLVFGAFIVGGGMGYFGKDYLPDAWTFQSSAGQTINLLPIFCTIFVTSILSAFILAAVEGLKSIYYSIFYASLNRPLEICEELRDEVTNYLNYKNQVRGYDFFEKFKVKEDKTLDMSAHAEFDQAQVDKVKKSYESNLSKGHGPEKIKTFLVQKGIKKELADFAFEEFLEEGSAKILPFINSKVAEGHSKAEVEKFFHQKGVPTCILRKALKAG
ncbi:MAG: hypothetical protein H0V66_05040 [Bdellovibrionales bacterium]|nr:hypothetical protein [Bdellovibrionales bacterium]